MPEQSHPTGSVFLSYASQDAEAAARIGEALRATGVDVWLDKSELRGGDAWDAQIKKHIHDCAIFIPVISAHTNARAEGYFRREWRQATRRLQDMADDLAFLVPVVVDDTREADARVPEEFLRAQWTWLPGGETPPAFTQRVRQLLGVKSAPVPHSQPASTSVHESRAKQEHFARSWFWFAGRGKHRVRSVSLAVIALLLVLVGGLLWYYQNASDAPAAKVESTALPAIAAVAPDDKSIAVLPFADMSAGKDQEYFADGLSDELLNLLAKLPELRVIGRTSSFQFKGRNEDLRAIGEQLNVAHILEGSVRKSGEKLRITAQLIRAADGSHLWSESYDRTLDDIFAVQDDIAGEVVKALKLALLGTKSVTRSRPVDPEAYNLVLEGNYFYFRGKLGDEAKAVELFQRATVRDPKYAVAWAKLSRALGWQGYIGDLAADDAIVRGRSAAERALKIDPNCAEAYYARGNISKGLAGEWEAALSDYEKTAALDPNGQVGGEAEGSALMLRAEMSGHIDAIIDWSTLWLESSPLDGQRMFDLARLYQVDGNLEASAAMFRRLLEMNPDWPTGPTEYGVTLLLMGKHVEALAAVKMEPNESYRLFGLTVVYWALDRRAESDSALDALKKNFPARKAYEIASAHAYRGEETAAFTWLDRAYQERRGSLEYLKVDPLFQGLHQDPRFAAWLRKAKLTH